MGLDMYLYGSRYISKYFNDTDEQLQSDLAAKFPELAPLQAKDAGIIKKVKAEVGYWRKDNHIHQWFVDNVQDGTDDCRPYYVTREQLQELKDLCLQVLEDRNPENLPRAYGFFFGSTEIDEGYWESLTDTINIIDNCLSLPLDWKFQYQSSW